MSTKRSHTKGFAILEIIIAIAFWAIVFPSLLIYWIHQHKPFDVFATYMYESSMLFSHITSGDIVDEFDRDSYLYSKQFNLNGYKSKRSFLQTNWNENWGKKDCLELDASHLKEVPLQQSIDLGGSNVPTAIIARNNYLYITANSSSTTDPDFFIVDVHDPSRPVIRASIDTGPGLSSLKIIGFTAYVGNISTKSQLQALDISNPYNPQVIWSYKVNGSNASTSPLTRAVAYYNGNVFIGTQKTTLAELYMIDVNGTIPVERAEYEIGAGINDLFASHNKLYVAVPSDPELQVFDISSALSFIPLSSYDAPGAVGNGKKLDIYNADVFLGRTVGGDELNDLHFSTTNPSSTALQLSASSKIKASIDSILSSRNNIYVLNSDSSKELQVWNKNKDSSHPPQTNGLQLSQSIDLPFRAADMDCDGTTLYVVLSNKDALREFTAQ